VDEARPAGSGHDLILIGASAGGIHALQRILADLPSDLPAAVLVVVHLGATSHLAQVLARGCSLPVQAARDGEALRQGTVLVAVPDHHLLVHNAHVMLRRGPHENLSRPAVDPLFRSAAASYGPRCVGVVLSGALNDGTAGLLAIKRCGGLAVIQDPEEAIISGMPTSALRHVATDHVAEAAAIGPLLARLVRTAAPAATAIPFDIRLEAAIAAQERSGMATEDALGTPSRFTCPRCHGTLWEITDGSMLRYRCHVGHAFTAEAVLAEQQDAVETMLWSLLRAHRERAALARRLSEAEDAHGRPPLAESLRRRAVAYEEDAATIGELLTNLRTLAETEARAQQEDPA
jgi:two-component system, chemotaxis family, protein-glutamate methylesterase/glutaminase